MRIIDLLNKIANGEKVPKKISFCCRNFEYQENINDYCCIDKNNKELEDYCLGVSICKWIFPNILNYEVEILEEEKKIPEKLHHCYTGTENEDIKFLIKNINYFVDRYNELLDYLESKGE